MDSSIVRVNVSASTINVCIKRTLKNSKVVATGTVEVIHHHR